MKVAVIQSNYIPWKGYFDIINDVDLFIFYDDVQYTKNDWRNRNQIRTHQGLEWLTIPVGENINRVISDVNIPTAHWQKKHWKSLQQNYGKAPFFKMYQSFFEELYINHKWESLSALNQFIIKHISTEFLGITTQFTSSENYNINGKKLDRLLNLLQYVGTKEYISGISAQSYIEESIFAKLNIKLTYKDYSNYPKYNQLYAPFYHNVSILDILFNCGPEAPYYIWGWRTTNN